MDQQIGLDLGDPRIIRQVGDVLGLLDVLAVIGRQAGNGALQIADRSQMLIETMPVRLAQSRLQFGHVLLNQVQNALLAIHPALVLHAEQAVKQILRNHLRRQRAIISRPTHVAMHVFAVRFLRDSDLQRMESRLGSHLRRQNLVDRGAAGAASCIGRAGHQSAHGGEVPIALPVESGRDVIDSADDVNVVAHRIEWGQGTAINS